MEPKQIVRCLFREVEPRKEILSIPYCRGKERGKKIEEWVNTEMLAKLIELNKKKILDEVEGEHPYHIKTGRNYKRCDLWWNVGHQEHWLEVKTLRFQNNTKGLKKDYKERITKDLDRVENISSLYIFHHLLIVFDDNYYDNGNWLEDVSSLYNDYDMKKEDEWKIEIDERRTLNAFLHFKSKIDSKS